MTFFRARSGLLKGEGRRRYNFDILAKIGKYQGTQGKVKSSCKYPGGGKNERN
jgi:hypothetical protein